jgi:hypothetical protein
VGVRQRWVVEGRAVVTVTTFPHLALGGTIFGGVFKECVLLGFWLRFIYFLGGTLFVVLVQGGHGGSALVVMLSSGSFAIHWVLSGGVLGCYNTVVYSLGWELACGGVPFARGLLGVAFPEGLGGPCATSYLLQ